MKPSLKKLFRDIPIGRDAPVETIKVCLTLRTSILDKDTRVRLEEKGLQISRKVKNKLYGSLLKKNLSRLRADPDVEEAEISVQYRAH